MNIADHALGDPQSPALIVADGGHRPPEGQGDDTISYGDLYERSQRVAALLHEHGLRRGDGVALVLPNRSEFLEITWGCQLSGLYYTAVNTHFTPDEVGYVIDDSDARAVFVDASMAELAPRILDANAGVDLHVSVGGEPP
ncbi:MAG TPA: AMP-binding protein, partial [Mycobacterium sp.]|nr:AMP-binding protein [Mycobacterium sp.]